MPALDAVEPIEVDRLLGVGQERSPIFGFDGHCGERGGDVPLVDPHVVGEDDPLVLDDVGVGGEEPGSGSANPLAFLDAMATDAEVVRRLVGLEGRAAPEPPVAWVWLRSMISFMSVLLVCWVE